VVGVPTNALLDQYVASVRGFATLRARKYYECPLHKTTCDERKKRDGAHCRSVTGNKYAKDACKYVADLASVRSSKKTVVNWYTAMAHGLGKAADVLIFDEAHGLPNMIKELGGKILWRHDLHWPRTLESIEDVEKWLASDDAPEPGAVENVDLLRAILDGSRVGMSIWLGESDWRNEERECIRLLPLDTRDCPPLLWPNPKARIVLMSATLSRVDVEQLGLAGRRVAWIEMPSEIDEARRPLVWWPAADMRHAARATGTEIPKLVAAIRHVIAQHPGERGVIHATYGLAKELRGLLGGVEPRLKFHSRDDKRAALDDFLRIRSGGDDRVLVLSGQYEGLDLHGELARFQVLTQIPRPSIDDPGLSWLCENKPDEYLWLAIRDLAQAYGRTCRGPTDYGVTILLDSSADRELNSPLLPKWMPRITRA
jgi:Rad3-related DNA helicase